MVRYQSLSKPANESLQQRGVAIVPLNLDGLQSQIIAALYNIDILISAVSAFDYHVQIPLATAAKAAGVKRFLPCSFTSVAPPGGFSRLRDAVSKTASHAVC